MPYNIAFGVTGLVSECSTVGSLNWSGMKQPKQEADSTGGETAATGDGAPVKQDGEAGPPKEDGTEGEKSSSRDVADFEALYNCVVYGLPHITLVPPS